MGGSSGGGAIGPGGSSSSGGAAGAAAAAGAGGSGGTGTVVDLMDGYWELTASDSGGQDWTPSTLVFTSATTDPSGVVTLDYRIDWFENAGGNFGVLLAGEEYGVGTYDPGTAHLVLNQTGGFDADVIDQYETDYDVPTQGLVNGFWNTGVGGTFTGAHRLSGHDITPLVASASTSRASLTPDKAIDVDMMTYWSSANGKTIGETFTLTLPAPTELSGFRLLSYIATNDAAPSRLTVHCFDDVGTETATEDVILSADPMWKPVSISANAVSSIDFEVTEIDPVGGNRIILQSIEVFGLP